MTTQGILTQMQTHLSRINLRDWRHVGAIALFFVLLAITAYACSGCETVGVADPEVRGAAADVADALESVYNNADVPALADEWCVSALSRLTVFTSFDLSELDQMKVNRIREGIESIRLDIENEPYVRQRALSLRRLAESIGAYDNEYLQEIEEAIPQTQPENSGE